MPVGSSFADVAIPNVDMWSLMLETKRDFPESQGLRPISMFCGGILIRRSYLQMLQKS